MRNWYLFSRCSSSELTFAWNSPFGSCARDLRIGTQKVTLYKYVIYYYYYYYVLGAFVCVT